MRTYRNLFKVNTIKPILEDYTIGYMKIYIYNNIDNNVENNKSEFQKMLDRNLELTRKEKEKRGFSLNNKK